jgi:hypothetical protein
MRVGEGIGKMGNHEAEKRNGVIGFENLLRATQSGPRFVVIA